MSVEPTVNDIDTMKRICSNWQKSLNVPINLCSHHSSKFSNNSKAFASFIMKSLYDGELSAHIKVMFIAVDSNICQQCAYQLAIQLPTFLNTLHKKNCDHTASGYLIFFVFQLLMKIIDYPSLVRFYFHTKLWKHIFRLFSETCKESVSLAKKYFQDRNDPFFQLPYSLNFIQKNGWNILEYGYFMQESKYWRRGIKNEMNYVLAIFNYAIHETEDDVIADCVKAAGSVQFLIHRFLYYRPGIPQKLQSRYNGYIAKYRKGIKRIYDIIEDDEENCCNKIIKHLCLGEMKMIDGTGVDTVEDTINTSVEHWNTKKKTMKCLWSKCNAKAMDLQSGKLRKCKRCRVARYCSKYCQKRDWKYGHHKEICHKFVEMRQ